MEKRIIDGIEVEVYRNYHETGELNQEWLQTTYELHGYHKTYYRNGQLKEIQEYRNNNWIGVDNRFFENGKIQKETKKINDSLFFCEEWFINGIKKSEYYLTNNKQSTGNRKDWYDNGILNYELTFTDSAGKNGTEITYNQNADICLRAKYVNGVFYVVDYFDLNRKQTLTSGNGYIETFENGKLKYYDNYKDGLRHGSCRIYSKEGLLRCDGEYLNGKANGKTIWYNATGGIEKIVIMKDDIITDVEEK